MDRQVLIFPICKLAPAEDPADMTKVVLEEHRENCSPTNKMGQGYLIEYEANILN